MEVIDNNSKKMRRDKDGQNTQDGDRLYTMDSDRLTSGASEDQ